MPTQISHFVDYWQYYSYALFQKLHIIVNHKK
jgi:hypothetical protein